MPIFTDIAPNWAKAVATVAAARNGKNMGIPFGFVGDKEKRPGNVDVVQDLSAEDARMGDVWAYAGLASVTGMIAGGQRDWQAGLWHGALARCPQI